MPFKSPFVDLQFPDVDIWTMYFELPRPYADDHTLLISGETGRSYTFADLKRLTQSFGQGLKHTFNWSKGDVLAFFSPNDIDTPIVNFGTHWAGGVASPANPTYTADELARQLKDSGAKALVTQKPFLQTACKAAESAGLPLDRIFLLGEGRDETGKFRHWTDITAKGAWFTPKKTLIDPKKDLAYLVYSSGTTGLPKGVVLTHFNIVANSFQARRMDIKSMLFDIDGQLGMLPFFHIYGLGVVLNTTLCSGAKCVTMAKFDLEKACKLIQDHALTYLYVPPPIVLALGKHPTAAKYDLSSLKWINSAAAPLSNELVELMWSRLAIPVKQGYGLSETSPSVTTQAMDEFWKNQGSVGKLLSNIQGKIVDPEGKELPDGEAGELLLKGPNIFSGYWNKAELNKDTFTEDGWYKTGDVFYRTPKGDLYITDRIKELIKYKGFQVPPAELEAKIIGREDVADVCVIGIWNDDQQTEVPRAYIQLKPGVTESDKLAKEIVAWLGERVGPPKRLRGGVRFVKEIPKSGTGKILRRVLKDQVKKEQAAAKAKL